MTVRIDIQGFSKSNTQLNQITKFITNLDKKVITRISKSNEDFMRRVKKGAKNRAPIDTGALKDSIKLLPVRKGKNVKIWKLVAGNNTGAEHAIFQEEGFRPHRAPIFNSSKLSPGVYMVSKFTPFIKPAVESQLNKFSQKLGEAVIKAIKK